MVSFTILAGGYDAFMAVYLFSSLTCTLDLVNKWPTGPHPSWVTAHPRDNHIIYAINEVADGAVQSFIVDDQGELVENGSTISSGGSPAFAAALSTGEVAVMNYGGGNGRIIPTAPPGEYFIDIAPIITFPPPVNGTSHPHMALEYYDEVLVPDLGADTIWRLARSCPFPFFGCYEIQGSIPQPEGSGPRHIAIFDDRLFTLHELTSTLTVQQIPEAPNGTSSIIASISITPPNPPDGAKFAAAEILIPPPSAEFPIPYIYVSNRNTGVLDPRGDTIAIFEHCNKDQPDEELRLVRHVYTGLDQIRGMEFGPAPSEYLIASGFQGTGGVVMLRRNDTGRDMEIVARNTIVPTRTSFVWL